MSQSKIESPDMRQALQALSDSKGFIELPDFIQTALYHPTLGYYRLDQQRVGRSAKTDFFTASSLKEAFSEIVTEAAVARLQKANLDPAETTWVEIGAEPNSTLLDAASSPFKTVEAIRVGQPIKLAGQLVIFSNELFDAQPFRQIRFENNNWTEYGIHIDGNQLDWTPRDQPSVEVAAHLDEFPQQTTEGYTIDLPTGSAQLANQILAQSWTGAFIACDYGKTLHNLIHDTPQGSARGYSNHKQVPNILQNAGEQDITHHICWDHLETALAKHGFANATLQSQEAFIVHQAPKFLQKVFDPSRDALDPSRTKLKELIHPALMGQKFQALAATRL